jgi:hypothetical protein
VAAGLGDLAELVVDRLDHVGTRYEGVDAAGLAGGSPLVGVELPEYGATVRDKGRRE